MNKERLIPLIVATALFMENIDSTVIATSLPAIAADIGTSPLTLKLAITSYLLSLAVFIPASGWTADRFGARMVFRVAIAVFMVGSIGCALSHIPRPFRDRAHPAGHRRRDDDPGRATGAAALDRQERAGERDGLGHDPGADRPGDRPAARRLHHHLFFLALDLPDQHSDRPARHLSGAEIHRSDPQRRPRALRPLRAGAGGARTRRHRVRALGRRAQSAALDRHRRAGRDRHGFDDALRHPRPANRLAGAGFLADAAADAARQHHRRLPVPARHRRAAVPAAAVDAGRLRPVAVPLRNGDVRIGGRRHGHEDAGGADHPHLRLPQH